MTETAILLDEIRRVISDWINENNASDVFDGIFIFGSLIHRDGRHFVPQGSMASDVDLVLTIRDDLPDAISRAQALINIRGAVQALEHSTATVLKRATDEEIYSLLPLTSYEVHQCIHKGHDPKLFTSNLFLNVITGVRVNGGLANYVDYDYHYENLEAFSTIRLCQSYRNKYLRCNQVGVFAQGVFDGETIFPKEIMRGAALLGFYESDRTDESRRTDLEAGQNYLVNLLRDMTKQEPDIRDLMDKVDGRGFARGTSDELSAEDMLLLHEIMFDKARSLVVPSIRDSIREVIAADIIEAEDPND